MTVVSFSLYLCVCTSSSVIANARVRFRLNYNKWQHLRGEWNFRSALCVDVTHGVCPMIRAEPRISERGEFFSPKSEDFAPGFKKHYYFTLLIYSSFELLLLKKDDNLKNHFLLWILSCQESLFTIIYASAYHYQHHNNKSGAQIKE